MKSMSMIVFPGTDILYKPLLNNHFTDKNLGPAGGKLSYMCKFQVLVQGQNGLYEKITAKSNPVKERGLTWN